MKYPASASRSIGFFGRYHANLVDLATFRTVQAPWAFPFRTPTPFKSHRDKTLFRMQYCGARTPKGVCERYASDLPAFGQRFGEWLAKLHHEQASCVTGRHQSPMGVCRLLCRNLEARLIIDNLDGALTEQMDAIHERLLTTDDDTMCHKNYTPNKILVDSGQSLTVVDWELTHRGNGP